MLTNLKSGFIGFADANYFYNKENNIVGTSDATQSIIIVLKFFFFWQSAFMFFVLQT